MRIFPKVIWTYAEDDETDWDAVYHPRNCKCGKDFEINLLIKDGNMTSKRILFNLCHEMLHWMADWATGNQPVWDKLCILIDSVDEKLPF